MEKLERMDTRIVQCVIIILVGLCSATQKDSIGHKEEQEHKEKQVAVSSSISTTQNDVTTPIPTVPTTNPVSSSRSWCVATQFASETALQVALDYSCGSGGADCSAIQPSGSCYNPITVRSHASFAFNTYYHNNPVPPSCNFGGTAVITNIDPSYGTCQYPCTSTTSSVLNTTNSSGSRIFGGGPSNPTNSAAALPSGFSHFFISTCINMLLVRNHQ